ncbi:MAG: ANTAR domain-containing protein [Streptomycetaceae bacterium]|nr:ANTAR domain-containing protein [Streptomycetaceae bacterium]
MNSAILRLLRGLNARGAGGSGTGLRRLSARECAAALGVDGVVVSLDADDAAGELVWSSDPLSSRLDELQFTLDEGPSPECRATGAAVFAPDLAVVPQTRWPRFLPDVAALGVLAVFAIPLRMVAIRFGTLTCHNAAAGALRPTQLADVLTLTDAVTLMLVGDVAADADAVGWLDQPGALHRADVHQATGMVTVQLGVGPAEALLRLRTYAWHHNRSLLSVARDVVSRELRFERDRDHDQG